MTEPAGIQINLTEQESTDNNVSINNVSTDSAKVTARSQDALSSPASVPSKPHGLPYQVNHQVELLHLQAEIDALLQQLQTLKQERLASVEQASELHHSELHALI